MAKRRRINKVELGVTGLKRDGGVVREEFVRELKGTKKYRAFEEMRHNSPVVGGILHATSAIMRTASIAVQELGKGQQSGKARDLYYSAFYDMSSSWEDTQSEIIEEQIVHGSAYHEIVYKERGGWVEDGTRRSIYDDGLVAWRKLPIRARSSLVKWLFDDEGGVAGMVQRDPNGKRGLATIPIGKALLFRVGAAKGNPEGRSLLRPVYEPRYFEREIQRIEAIGIERELNGIPLAKVPPEIMHPSASDDDKALFSDIKDVVTDLRADEMAGVVFPMAFDEEGHPMFDLSLLSTQGRRAIDTDKVIARYQTRQGMALLASFVFLGMTSVGAKAVADSQIDLFKESLQVILNGNIDVFNSHARPRLMALNGFALRGPEWPKAVAGKVNAPRMDELADFVNRTIGVEAIRPDDALEDRLREVAHLPAREGAEVRKTRRRFGWRKPLSNDLSSSRRVMKVDYPVPDTYGDETRQRNYEEAYGETRDLFVSQSSEVISAIGAVSINDALGAAREVVVAQFDQWSSYLFEQLVSRGAECAVAAFDKLGVSPDLDAWKAAMEEQARAAANKLATHIVETNLRAITAEIQIGRTQGQDAAGLAQRIDAYYRHGDGPWRADLIAQDIATTACSIGARVAAKRSGATKKRWVQNPSMMARADHYRANGQTVGIDEKYVVAGIRCDGPHDPALPLEQRVQCHCSEEFLL